MLYAIWVASRQKVPNVLIRCHIKRRMGACGRTHLLLAWHLLPPPKKKLVSYSWQNIRDLFAERSPCHFLFPCLEEGKIPTYCFTMYSVHLECPCHKTRRFPFPYSLPNNPDFLLGRLPHKWLFNGIAIMIGAIFFRTRANQGTQASLCCSVYSFPDRL